MVLRPVGDALLAGQYNLNSFMLKVSSLEKDEYKDEMRINKTTWLMEAWAAVKKNLFMTSVLRMSKDVTRIDIMYISSKARETLVRKLYTYCTQKPTGVALKEKKETQLELLKLMLRLVFFFFLKKKAYVETEYDYLLLTLNNINYLVAINVIVD